MAGKYFWFLDKGDVGYFFSSHKRKIQLFSFPTEKNLLTFYCTNISANPKENVNIVLLIFFTVAFTLLPVYSFCVPPKKPGIN